MKNKFIKIIFALICIICFCMPNQNTYDKNADSLSKVILITIDGTRWQDLFDEDDGAGGFDTPSSRQLLPNIYNHFVDNGMAIGKLSFALVGGKAHVSMPGYLEIIRGYPTEDCFDNECPPNFQPTIFDQFPNDSAVFSGWDTIANIFDHSHSIVNIGRNVRSKQWLDLKLANNNSYVDEFDDEHYRSDRNTKEAVLDYARLSQPTLIWVSLGDTDEYAHQNNKLMYLNSLSSIDEFIGKLIKLSDPNTVYIICPDHGRSADFQNHHWDPPSRRVWIMIYGPGIPKAGFVSYPRDVYLGDVYWTIMDIAKGKKSIKSLLDFKSENARKELRPDN